MCEHEFGWQSNEAKSCWLCQHNPSINAVKELAVEMKRWGSDARLVGNGLLSDCDLVLQRAPFFTLAAYVNGDYTQFPNYLTNLSVLERSLLYPIDRSKVGKGNPVNMLFVLDWDGVAVPSFILEALTFRESPFHYGTLTESRLAALLDMVTQYDKTIISTSRWSDASCNDLTNWAKEHTADLFMSPVSPGSDEQYHCFPFMGNRSVKQLEHHSNGHICVATDKDHRKRSRFLAGLIKDNPPVKVSPVSGKLVWDVVYYLGSSRFDREAALRAVQGGVTNLIYLDSGHSIV